jgi:hypothetical protein
MEGGDSNTEALAGGRAWSVAAALFMLAALVCLWLGQGRAAFALAALGVVAWFLNVRGQLQRKNDEAEALRVESENEREDEDEI